MAATLTDQGELTYVSFPILKTENTPDGDVYVYGKATDGSVDSDEQIVDPDGSADAIQKWLSTGGNVRVQHNPQRDPAGVGVEATTDSAGATWVKSLIVEPVAKELVRKGVLRAYSVGISRPDIVRDSVARGGRIKFGPATEICEISLVDRPANKSCGIQLVKSVDGHAEFTGKMFGNTDVLTKGASTFSPADLAKLLEHRRISEKRQTDPDVGGGVDRDKIPAEDFAGKDRSFPIVTPGDVSDAASSIGRAGADNYSSDKIKSNIISIAKRKGAAFVAELPQSWKDDMAENTEKGKKSQDGKKPFPGAAKPFGDDEDTVTDEAKPDTTKGKKNCPKCGKEYHADSKMKNCENCGSKLPVAEKSEAVKAEEGRMCTKCDAPMMAKHKFCPECGASADAEKAKKPSPGDKVTGEDTDPVPDHREPDGKDVEDFEHDAKLPTDPDKAVKSVDDPEMMTAMRVKSAGAPMDMGALHDALCPGFHPDDVDKSYPGFSLSDLDVSLWQAKAMSAATGGTLKEAVDFTNLWQHAETIKSSDPWDLTEIRHDLFKSFQDANQGPGTFPKPTELFPGQFKRPVITSGHAVPGTDYKGPNTHSVPTQHMGADQFDREYLTAGHAANSPSNKSDASVIPAPVPTGAPSRTFYTNARRDSTRSAMAAMHDHIAQTFPDLCSMSGPGLDGEAPVGQRPVPVPDSNKSEETAPEKKTKKTKKADVVKAAGGDTGLTDLLLSMREELRVLTKSLDAERAGNAELRKTVETMGNLPDPATAPWRGVMDAPVMNKAAGNPAGARSVAETAAQTQMMMMSQLEEQFRTSPDPAQREAAWKSLMKFRGIV